MSQHEGVNIHAYKERKKKRENKGWFPSNLQWKQIHEWIKQHQDFCLNTLHMHGVMMWFTCWATHLFTSLYDFSHDYDVGYSVKPQKSNHDKIMMCVTRYKISHMCSTYERHTLFNSLHIEYIYLIIHEHDLNRVWKFRTSKSLSDPYPDDLHHQPPRLLHRTDGRDLVKHYGKDDGYKIEEKPKVTIRSYCWRFRQIDVYIETKKRLCGKIFKYNN